jgi:phage shock protein A
MVLNNPKAKELLANAAVTANQKVRQQIEAFVANEIEKATAPLQARIAALEDRVAALEAGRRPAAAGQAAPRRPESDPNNF